MLDQGGSLLFICQYIVILYDVWNCQFQWHHCISIMLVVVHCLVFDVSLYYKITEKIHFIIMNLKRLDWNLTILKSQLNNKQLLYLACAGLTKLKTLQGGGLLRSWKFGSGPCFRLPNLAPMKTCQIPLWEICKQMNIFPGGLELFYLFKPPFFCKQTLLNIHPAFGIRARA